MTISLSRLGVFEAFHGRIEKGRRSDLLPEVRRASCLRAILPDLEATGANIHLLALAIDNDSNIADVWLKGAPQYGERDEMDDRQRRYRNHRPSDASKTFIG